MSLRQATLSGRVAGLLSTSVGTHAPLRYSKHSRTVERVDSVSQWRQSLGRSFLISGLIPTWISTVSIIRHQKAPLLEYLSLTHWNTAAGFRATYPAVSVWKSDYLLTMSGNSHVDREPQRIFSSARNRSISSFLAGIMQTP